MEQILGISGGTPSAIRQHYYSRKIKLYFFSALILTLFIGFFGVEKYLEFSEKNTILEQSGQFLSDLEKTRQDENNYFSDLRENSLSLSEKIEQETALVFPIAENYTGVTRIFDVFAQKNHRSGNPFILTDLQFNDPVNDLENRYTVLPFSVSIESSEENFYRFLDFVDSSGVLAGKIRLMNITSIQLNFPDDDSEISRKRIHFTAQLEAYSQKIAVEQSSS